MKVIDIIFDSAVVTLGFSVLNGFSIQAQFLNLKFFIDFILSAFVEGSAVQLVIELGLKD